MNFLQRGGGRSQSKKIVGEYLDFLKRKFPETRVRGGSKTFLISFGGTGFPKGEANFYQNGCFSHLEIRSFRQHLRQHPLCNMHIRPEY